MSALPQLLFQFTIPHTPIAKGRARSSIRRAKGGKPILTKGGDPIIGHHTPELTRNYEAMVRDFAQQAAKGEPLTCPVDLVVEFRFRIRSSWPKWKQDLAVAGMVHHTQKPDCSNLVKAIEDACNGVLFHDDGQVVGSVQDKTWTNGAECVVVRGYRRAGIGMQSSRAEALEFLANYSNPSLRINHLPLGQRMRTLRLVAP